MKDEYINFLLNGQLLRKVYSNMYKEINKTNPLTLNEISILLFLSKNKSYDTAKDIVNLCLMTKSHVCKSIDSLIQKEFLKGEQDKEDRRRIHLKLQPIANPVIEKVQTLQDSFLSMLLSGVTEEEFQTLTTVYNKTASNLTQYIENNNNTLKP